MLSEISLPRLLVPWVICGLVPSLVSAADAATFAIVGYLPSYRVDTVRAEQARKIS
jgi:hypothetical protein